MIYEEGRIKVRCFEVLPTEAKGGEYETGETWYKRVFDLRVHCEDGCRYVYQVAFHCQEAASEFGRNVMRFGSINPDKWFLEYYPGKENELPDYAVHWYLPEYN